LGPIFSGGVILARGVVVWGGKPSQGPAENNIQAICGAKVGPYDKNSVIKDADKLEQGAWAFAPSPAYHVTRPASKSSERPTRRRESATHRHIIGLRGRVAKFVKGVKSKHDPHVHVLPDIRGKSHTTNATGTNSYELGNFSNSLP
jgi:hypothetical protein